jgi:hypothetical protein
MTGKYDFFVIDFEALDENSTYLPIQVKNNKIRALDKRQYSLASQPQKLEAENDYAGVAQLVEQLTCNQ